MAENYELIKSSFSSYLSKPYWDWTYFVTQTFDPSKVKPYKRLCEHSWRFFLSRCQDHAAISYGFCFSESHKSGLRHWHALVHVTPNLLAQPDARSLWESMHSKYGRSQILPYKESNIEVGVATVSTGVSRYLTKYLVKESASDDAWWDFNGNMGGKPADAGDLMFAIGGAPIGKL